MTVLFIVPADVNTAEICISRPPNRPPQQQQQQQQTNEHLKQVVSESDVVVLAVKPDVIPTVLREIEPDLADDSLIVSIAAGVPLAVLEEVGPIYIPGLGQASCAMCLILEERILIYIRQIYSSCDMYGYVWQSNSSETMRRKCFALGAFGRHSNFEHPSWKRSFFKFIFVFREVGVSTQKLRIITKKNEMCWPPLLAPRIGVGWWS